MSRVRVHRVAILRSFADFLDDIGAPWESGFRRAGLPIMALEDVSNYVPSSRFLSFVTEMACREGIGQLGYHVGRWKGANSLEPRLAEELGRAPTLLQGILKFCEFANKIVTGSRIELFQPSTDRRAFFCHRPSCSDTHPAIAQIGWFGLTTMMGVVREFAGPGWQPSEIGLISDVVPERMIRDEYPNTRFRLAQGHSYLAIETEMLCLPPLGLKRSAAASLSRTHDLYAGDFAGSLKRLLRSYILDYRLTMEFAAELCSTSTRTLHRRLAACGTSYSRLLDEVRYGVAAQMLQDSDVPVFDIAHAIGYSDTPHFTRAFRRLAGVCPSEYRRQHSLSREVH